MRFNLYERSLSAGADVLGILEGNSFVVAVVNAEAGGDGILQVFDAANEVVSIELCAPEADHADHHAARAACLRLILSRSLPDSIALRLGAR